MICHRKFAFSTIFGGLDAPFHTIEAKQTLIKSSENYSSVNFLRDQVTLFAGGAATLVKIDLWCWSDKLERQNRAVYLHCGRKTGHRMQCVANDRLLQAQNIGHTAWGCPLPPFS